MAQLHFCELCEVSIPERDLKEALAVDLQGKALCQACLAKALAKVPATGGGDREGPDAMGKGSFPFFLAFMLLLLCFLGGVWFLQSQISEGFQELGGRQEKIAGTLSAYEELWTKPRKRVLSPNTKALADLKAKLSEIQGTLSVLRVHLKTKSPSSPSGSKEMGTQIRDLIQRQSALERGVFDLERKLTGALAGVSRELKALRRKSLAIPAGSGGKSGGEGPADLPERLGRFADDLEDAEVSKRWTAVDELVSSGDPKVVPYLLPRLKDRDVYVRRHCAKGLGKLGDKRAVPALIDALEDPEAVVRQAALKSLKSLAGRNFSFDPEASAASRKRALKVIRNWWEKQK
ncbi:MAG TPA: HEAT repeat domain-containing protein [Planctomycetes bacterium]|nr:HEAT repeat domain-containing protein [Planctomycetota bacterium]